VQVPLVGEHFQQSENHALAELLVGFFADDRQSFRLRPAARDIFQVEANWEAMVFPPNEAGFSRRGCPRF